MHTIFTLWTALLAWLNAVDGSADALPPQRFDADLPPYHPRCD